MFYPEILDRYIDILLQRDPKVHVCPNPEEPTSDGHLLWMINELETSRDMSNTKKHRWLGYIQGVLVTRGILNVNEERDLTRKIFNGK